MYTAVFKLAKWTVISRSISFQKNLLFAINYIFFNVTYWVCDNYYFNLEANVMSSSISLVSINFV